MYFALPPSLQSLIDLSGKEGDDVALLPEFLDAMVKGLCVLGTPNSLLLGLRRHLHLLGPVSESATQGVSSLEALLRRHDLLIDDDSRGFANLLRSAIDNDEVFSGDTIDFDALQSNTQDQLKFIGDAAAALLALDDLTDALSVNADRVAACMVLAAVDQWRPGLSVCKWLQQQDHLKSTYRLFTLSSRLENLSVDFVQRDLQREDLRDFVLWLLACILAGHIKVEPLEKRLIDTMLKKAELGSLATFERVGF